jgi:protein-disulfide isomerase
MKTNTLLCLVALTWLSACAGENKTTRTAAAEPSKGSSEESCRNLAKQVCEGSGQQSALCSSMSTAILVLPPSSCADALNHPEFIAQQLVHQKESCDKLLSQLCGDLGEKSAGCAMVRDKGPELDAQRCQYMLAHYNDVLTELRQFEKESAPLSPEDQKAIAAGNGPAFGPVNAKVTLVLFSDFQCPYCAKAAEAAEHLKKHYSDKIRFVFRQFPLSFHKQARLAAEASLLAHASGKFWEYHDQLFANQEHLEVDSLESYARAAGLEGKGFREKLLSRAYDSQISSDIELGERMSVKGTPTLFINGKRANNATSVADIVREVEAALAE